ncbi:hypothetical protein H9C73_08080 [Marinobacterium sp. AK62]|uniref:Uncharacterized protein n=1 Tax=Marinobacterium alkalitolerans TaxID=1542925 RepID=A0ABS3ZAH1_9GAMM|nr:hypothetical protein [Marinobacterium alkalitolerans]MBP0048693.1 hypothetical protein [Marinobacterium alkalitolerans]
MNSLDQTGQYGLAEFFRHQLERLAGTQAGEDTRWYIGNLLERFSQSSALYSYEEGELSIRPLTLLYGDAQQCRDERERCLLLRQLGDQALFLGALFPGHYARKGIRRDYLIGMGSAAYDYLADHAREWGRVFEELARRFASIMLLVARVCHREKCYSASEIMALYQRWQVTRDQTLAEQLSALGIQVDSGQGGIH